MADGLTLTGPDHDTIACIVHTLIDERLIASANIIPTIRSVYRWKGEVRDTGEALALLQATHNRVPAIIERVTQLHPYKNTTSANRQDCPRLSRLCGVGDTTRWI